MYIITIVALVLAASLGWFAYRLLREDRRRADARVAVLTAALDRAEPVGWDTSARQELAGTAPLPDVRAAAVRPDVAGGDTPLAAVRALPELVFVEDDVRDRGAFRSEHDWVSGSSAEPADTELATAPVRVGGLLADVPEARRGDARGVIAVVALVIVAALALAYAWWPAAPAQVNRAAAAAARAETAAAPVAVPLQLTALGHEQRRGALVVRGVVRNPVAGSDQSNIIANVALLDAEGGVLDSGRAAVQATVLRPGRDGEFSVTMPAHPAVRRYRVTFLAADGSLVAHADRRGGQP